MNNQNIKCYDADEAFFKVLERLQDSEEYSPRGKKVKEIINLTVIIENPLLSIITNKSRNIKENYIINEIKWYKKATKSIEFIQEYAKMWELIADENNEVNSNYGVYIWNQNTPENKTQFDFVVDTLKNDKDSRQALININQVFHKYKTKDFPCTINLQYFIRDNKLIAITNMRSNDIIFGFGNDLPFFTYLQYLIFDKLKEHYKDLELGKYYHNTASMHIYENHYNKMIDCINEYKKNKPKSKSITSLLNKLKND